MEKDIGLCDLVFAYYESQILFGYRKYGERLPSIAQISDTFRLGQNTVRGAYTRLKEQGYVQAEARKATTVAYRGTSEDFERNKAQYFVPREEGIRDFFQAAKLLFLPIGEAERKNTGKQNPVIVNRRGFEKLLDDMPSVVRFSVDSILPLENELLTNLYWECLRYVCLLSFLPRSKNAGSGRETPDGALRFERVSYSGVKDEIFAFISMARAKYHLEQVEPIPFKWNVYRQRPQVRFTLASKIINGVFWGEYPVGSYLPSLTEMAEQYHVSLATARRTVALLNALGVTKSYHGSGTKICMDAVSANLSLADVREDMRLHRESLQLMGLTIRGVTLYTLKSVSKARREALGRELSTVRAQRQGFLCFGVILNFICRDCPSMIVRECYSRLKEFVVWGCITVLPLLKEEDFIFMYDKGILQLETYLQKNDFEAFADGWQSLMEAHLKNNSTKLESFADDWQSFMEEKTRSDG